MHITRAKNEAKATLYLPLGVSVPCVIRHLCGMILAYTADNVFVYDSEFDIMRQLQPYEPFTIAKSSIHYHCSESLD
jgi:hypothetical protein